MDGGGAEAGCGKEGGEEVAQGFVLWGGKSCLSGTILMRSASVSADCKAVIWGPFCMSATCRFESDARASANHDGGLAEEFRFTVNGRGDSCGAHRSSGSVSLRRYAASTPKATLALRVMAILFVNPYLMVVITQSPRCRFAMVQTPQTTPGWTAILLLPTSAECFVQLH